MLELAEWFRGQMSLWGQGRGGVERRGQDWTHEPAGLSGD